LIALRAGASRFQAFFAVAATTLLVAALLALPAGALGASTQLSAPTVTPKVGTTATTFTFTVFYQNHEGSGAPNEVTVVIDGVKHAMVPGGNDWKSGVTFTYSTKLPAGSHTIAFHSLGRDRFVFDLPAGTVTVGAAPTPAPTGRPSPPPTTTTSRPPSAPSSAPGSGTSGSGSSGAGGTASGGSTGGSAGGSTGGSSGSGSSGSGVTRPFGDGRSDVARAGGPYRSARVISHTSPAPASAPRDDGRQPAIPAYSGAGWGDLAVYLKALSWGGSATRTMPLLPSILFTVGTMVILMAFMFFGKRRRDGEPPEPDEVLSAAAARGTGHPATATLIPQVVPDIPADEISMPRWRRPSLLEARKMDPGRSAVAAAPPLSFSRSAVGPLEGHERRYIRYHVVGLLDIPDEFRGTEIGELARDDEVQLLERSGTYWRVLCPDGREGWIHKMTLGDVVGEPSSPTPAEAWAYTKPWDDMENGVLTAFMAARGRP